MRGGKRERDRKRERGSETERDREGERKSRRERAERESERERKRERERERPPFVMELNPLFDDIKIPLVSNHLCGFGQSWFHTVLAPPPLILPPLGERFP